MIKTEDSQWISQWPDGIIAINSDSNIAFASPAAEELLGWSTDELTGKTLHETICVDTREFSHDELDCPLNLGSQDSTLNTQSGVWRKKDGVNVNVDYRLIKLKLKGNVNYVISFISSQDLEYNQAELDKFAAYANHSPAPIAEFDEQGYMLFGNSSLQELLIEYGFTEQGNPRILPAEIDTFCRKSIETNTAVTAVEINIGGTWFSWNFYPLETSFSTSVLGYAFDITDRKEAEEVARIERARSRRDFYAKMIHELRTPLNAIIGFADVLIWRAAKNLSEKDIQLIKTIKVAGLQLNDQVSDTLDVSKIEAGKMEVVIDTVNIRKILEEIDEQMRSLAMAKKLEYSFDCSETIAIASDSRKLKQILVNLVSNAVKYTRKGSVSVNVDLAKVADKNSEDEVEGIQICVKDTGVGIPQDQLDGLFQTYVQVKEDQNRSIQGTGIGLALVEELIRLLEAEIVVESTYGEGSSFIVKLPLEF